MGVLDWFFTIPAIITGLINYPLPTILFVGIIILLGTNFKSENEEGGSDDR